MKLLRDFSFLVPAGIGYGLIAAFGFEHDSVATAFAVTAGICCGLAFAAMEAMKQ